MSLWSRIANAISSLTRGESLSDVFEKLKTPPEPVSYTNLTLPTILLV